VHPAIDLLANQHPSQPDVKDGYKNDLMVVCEELGIKNDSYSNTPWVTAQVNAGNLELIDKKTGEKSGMVPDVTGMGLRDALYLLENCGLQVSVSGAGTVLSQNIQPGTEIQKGQSIL